MTDLARDRALPVPSMGMWGYMLSLAFGAARNFWSAGDLVTKGAGITALCIAAFNRPLAQKLMGWEGVSPWWGLAVLAAVFLYYCLRAGYAREVALVKRHGERTAELEARAAVLEHERDEARAALAETATAKAAERDRESLYPTLQTLVSEAEKFDPQFIVHDPRGTAERWRGWVMRAREILEKHQPEWLKAFGSTDYRWLAERSGSGTARKEAQMKADLRAKTECLRQLMAWLRRDG